MPVDRSERGEGIRDSELHAFLLDRIADAQIERDKHEDQWDLNLKMYLNVPVSRGEGQSLGNMFAVPRIQNAVIVQTAIQTEEFPKIVFRGREIGEKPEIYLNKNAADLVPLDIGISGDQLAGEKPITQEQFDALKDITKEVPTGNLSANPEAAMIGAPETMEVPVFTDEDFVFVNEATCGEALTQEIAGQAELAYMRQFIKKSIENTNVVGHHDAMIQWDPIQHRFLLESIYPYNAWIDRWADNTWDACYYAVRRILSVEQAIREYPQFKEKIKEFAIENTAGFFEHGRTGGKYDGTSDRQTVEVLVYWERDYPMDMTEEEAVMEAHVATQFSEEADGVESSGSYVLTDEEGIPTDEAVSPGDSRWPKKYVIRQIEMVGDIVVFDGESDFPDIPVARNKNITIPESPYAIGEPHRLQDLQELQNRLWDIFYHHFKYFKHPQMVIPQSVKLEVGKSVEEAFSSSSKIWRVPDNLIRLFGDKVISSIPIPVLGDAIFKLIQLVGEELDRASGMTDVLRGEAKSEWSAKLFDSATQAAKGPIGYKARNTRDWIFHLMRMAAEMTVNYLPMRVWSQRNKKYPEQVLRVMRDRLRKFGFDISIEVSGEGVRERDVANMTDFTSKMGVVTPTLLRHSLDKLNVPESDKVVEEYLEQQAQQQQAAQEQNPRQGA